MNLVSLSLRQQSERDWVSLVLGMCFGLMPVTAYAAPLIVVLMSLVFGVPHITRKSLIFGFFVIQYCIVQYFFLQYHGSSPIWDFDLIKVYAVLSVAAVPFSGLVGSHLMDLKKFEVGYFCGIVAAAAVLGYQYFYEHQCRAVGFTSNPLIPPFILIPLLGYIMARRVSEGRSSGLDLVSLVLGMFMAGLFPGGRMGLYSVTFIFIIFSIRSVVKLDWRRAAFTWGAITFGLVSLVVIDGHTGCNFLGRLSAQFRIAETFVERLDQSAVPVFVEPRVEVFPIPDKNDSAVNEDSSTNLVLGSVPSEASFVDLTTQIMQGAERSSRLRWLMWENAFSRLAQFRIEWLTGIGRAGEVEVVDLGRGLRFKHVHNQFLSWLLWGGLPSMLSAILLFGWLPVRALSHFPSAVFVIAIGLGFMTNSLMLSGQAVSACLLVSIFINTLKLRGQNPSRQEVNT